MLLDDEDFEKAERASTRAIEVVSSLARRTWIRSIERSYHVGPQKDAERPYEVLREAMRKAGRDAVVTFVMSNRQQYAVLRPSGSALALHTIYYGDEVSEPSAERTHPRPRAEEVKFAEQLIQAMSGAFEPAKYKDEYRETLVRVIAAKAEGKTVELPEAPRPRAKVVSLTDALRESLSAVRGKRAAGARPRRAAPARIGRKTARKRSA